MQQPRPVTAPTFYVTGRQTLRPTAVLLAILVASGVLTPVLLIRGRPRNAHRAPDSLGSTRSAGPTSAGAPPADEKDDPSQVDTIVLGDAADAPVPARRGDRAGDRTSNVHATILIRLPRFGDQVGLIPDSPTGHLLYGWLAAFNQASYPALESVLPNAASTSTATAQMTLRQGTGGFNLLSAKEIQPGVLVFRLRDQTPDAGEVLGTLVMRPNSSPAAIASFSLRAIPIAHGNAATVASPSSPKL